MTTSSYLPSSSQTFRKRACHSEIVLESGRLLEAHRLLEEGRLVPLWSLTGPRWGARISTLSVLKGWATKSQGLNQLQ